MLKTFIVSRDELTRETFKFEVFDDVRVRLIEHTRHTRKTKRHNFVQADRWILAYGPKHRPEVPEYLALAAVAAFRDQIHYKASY